MPGTGLTIEQAAKQNNPSVLFYCGRVGYVEIAEGVLVFLCGAVLGGASLIAQKNSFALEACPAQDLDLLGIPH
jgi:hypothetical protein